MSTENKNSEEAREQLVFIKSIMEDSQKVIADNGAGFIVWGPHPHSRFRVPAIGIPQA
ncbi:MAG: hypothetical protein HQ508_04800 [Candidatus Marinimicrobia bacterium]|nr:hypothetical protein [Candidatus Neomarinimicrobiota bacterium]